MIWIAPKLSYAQQNVGIGTSTPDPSAKLDVSTAADAATQKKGLLVPQISLSSTTDGSAFAGLTPVGPAVGLLVYNTNSGITGTGAASTGFYYNSGTKAAPVWKKLSDGGVAWLLSGNAGVGASNYIGTNDANDFVVRTNQNAGATPTTASERIRVTSAGDVVVNDGNNATIFRVEGDNDASLLKTTNDATNGDMVSVGVTGTPIQKLDVEGRIRVGQGVIQNGTTRITVTSDLGLYSLTSGNWIRIASNAAPIKFFTDQGGGNGGGTNSLVDFDNANGGGVAISANTSGPTGGTPNSLAILDLQSTTKGFLLPRMTTAQRDAWVGTIPEGDMIYNTTIDCPEWFDTKADPAGGPTGGFWNSSCYWCENVYSYNANSNGNNFHTQAGSPTRPQKWCVWVNAGITLGASTQSGTALDFSSLPAGSTVTVYNYGTIRGGGGNGGRGGQESDAFCQSDADATAGSTGGNAITTGINVRVIVFNYGEISAGGGGGGGGAGGCRSSGGSGGGGAGIPAGNGGAQSPGTQRADGGGCLSCPSTNWGSAGAAGTSTTGGLGTSSSGNSGTGCTVGTVYNGGTGGTGGGLGSAGGSGNGSTCGTIFSGGSSWKVGGNAGWALQGNGSGSDIINSGTQNGSVNP